MEIRRFVSGTSIILAGWLGVTFIREVPSQRYPKMERYESVSTELVPVPVPVGADSATASNELVLPVSFSH